MIRKWLCLLVALTVCCAPLSAIAEAGVRSAGVDAEVSDADFAGDTGLTVDAGASQSPADELPGAQSPEEEEAAGESADATGIRLSESRLSIGLKEKYVLLTATLSPKGATGAVTWSSSDEKTVGVDARTGALTGVKAGTATVTATTDNGHSAKCRVTVVAAPKSVKLNIDSATLSVGQTLALSAELPQGSASALTFTSSKKSVVTVDEHGVITAVKAGAAKITVRTFNKKKAVCKVVVKPEARQVFLPKTLTLCEGERKTIDATAADKRGKETVATFTYSAGAGTGGIAIDARTGEIQGTKAGTAFVYVSTHNGVTTHLVDGKPVQTVCAVTVKPGPAEVRLESDSVTIGVGQSLALSPVIVDSSGNVLDGARFTVTSSNPKKLSVSASGAIKGVAKGKYTVTVTAFNGVRATCAVKVVAAPSKVTLTPEAPTIGQGQTARIKAKFPKNTMASVSFSSSDKKVVHVDQEGNITGLQPGAATITAKTHNGKKAKAVVTVTRGPAFIALNADYELEYDPLTCVYSVLYTKTLQKGATFQIEYQNEYQTFGDIAAYESEDESIATVSRKGLVTAVSGGTTVIVVRSTGGAQARLKVTVSGAQTPSIAFNVDSVTLALGQSVPAPGLTGEHIDPARLASARYSSSNTNVFVAVWSEDEARWTLHALKTGKAILTAVADGASAEIPVEVVKRGAPSGIAFDSASAVMKVGESFTTAVLDDMGNAVQAEVFSENTAVATVDDAGVVTAVGEGVAVVTAVYEVFTATMQVRVDAADPTVTLNTTSLSLGEGQRFALEVEVNGERTLANVTFASSNAAVATVNRRGLIVARQAGITQITASAAGEAKAVCSVSVSPAPTALSVEPASILARLDDGGEKLVWRFGAPDEMGEVTFTSGDARVATVDEGGQVAFVGVGATSVTVRTGNGLTAIVPVTVLPALPADDEPSYRLFAAYSFFDTAYSGYLPFTRNNAKSVSMVFGASGIDGRTYSTKLMGNPNKTQLLSGIAGFFSDCGERDVSVVFLCSHGQMNSDYTGYKLLLPGYSDHRNDANYFVTAREIMNCLVRIPGRVILILDSCYSGTFLQDMTDALDAQEGRIAVLTAASDTRATYYNVKSASKAVDFFAYFMLQGLGYNEKEGYWNADASGGSGNYPGYLAADRMGKGDGDGEVTLGELFDYTARCIAANIPSYMNKSWYWGDKTRVQQPRYYPGALDDLVVYRPMK